MHTYRMKIPGKPSLQVSHPTPCFSSALCVLQTASNLQYGWDLTIKQHLVVMGFVFVLLCILRPSRYDWDSARFQLLTASSFTSRGCAGIAGFGDDKWAIKRPRGTNPAIERGDLEAIAAVAAAVASAGRPGSAPRNLRNSRFRCGPDQTQTGAQTDAAQALASPCAAFMLGPLPLMCKTCVCGSLAVWTSQEACSEPWLTTERCSSWPLLLHFTPGKEQTL